jgi:hypothetical protein
MEVQLMMRVMLGLQLRAETRGDGQRASRCLQLEIVPEVPDAGVEEAWLKETLRRRAEWKAGRAKAVPVEEALAQMFVKP